jgi:hypothetical protein
VYSQESLIIGPKPTVIGNPNVLQYQPGEVQMQSNVDKDSRHTQSPISCLCPILTADPRERIEHVVGVIFVLDRAQSLVMASIESLLEIRLPKVGLVKVHAPARG